MKINDLIEYTVEFAWQITDNNEEISRAESRWEVLSRVLDFIDKYEKLPNEDIDEVVHSYLLEKNSISR